MKKLLPALLALLGLAGGLVAGQILRPAPEAPPEAVEEDYATDPAADRAEGEEKAENFEYVKLDNQFVVPVMGEGRVAAMVVMSISLEVVQGHANDVHSRAPKLRDGFLRVLFEHERAGGFSGNFTDTRMLDDLRGRLLQVARGILGEVVHDVLVTDILRQDL
ncbi:MAG: flagellar basal body-associated protein FliL [Paracoccaceae bacterium]|nr:MAG: flagellar basal body-associated protein FliL [Paracoccaceae bacterium]